MKKLPTLLLLLILALSSCKAGSPAPTTAETVLPTFSANPPVSSPVSTPSPTPGTTWWEGKTAGTLPTSIASADSILTLDGPVCLALLPEESIGLYGDPDPTLGILLRKGSHLQFFPQLYSTTRYVLPELVWNDVDGDAKEELAIKYLVSDTDGRIVYEWHIYEWDGAEWTDRGFTPEVYLPILNDLISYRYENDVITLSAGGDSITAHYDGVQALKGLAAPGDLVFFRYEDSTLKVVFALQLALSNGGRYDIATLTATLTYDGNGFSMTNYSLDGLNSV